MDIAIDYANKNKSQYHLNQENKYAFDIMNRVTSEIDYLGKVTEYQYDVLGKDD